MTIDGSDIISLDCSSTVLDTIFFMKRNKIRRIVVTCEGKMAGLFTVDEAIKQIIGGSVEDKLKDTKLKRLVNVESNEPYEIAKSMIANSVDAVIFSRRIITEKD